jgi:DJ-1/PfpI family protein
VAFLFTEGVEQVELTEPLDAVRKAGADVDLVSLEAGTVQMFNHLDKGDTTEANLAVADADASDYDGLSLVVSPTPTASAPIPTPSASSAIYSSRTSRSGSSATAPGCSWRQTSREA